jgi:hypothetical protein
MVVQPGAVTRLDIAARRALDDDSKLHCPACGASRLRLKTTEEDYKRAM